MTTASHSLQRAFLGRVSRLDISAFQRLAALLLARAGYREVAVVPRSLALGYDLRAIDPSAGVPRRALVRLKQYGAAEPVARRHVDELRGACVRKGVPEGVLVTTGRFARNVDRATYLATPVCPVRLIDGAELFRLCCAHRVGVWEEPGAHRDAETRYGIDESYFRHLERTGPARRRASKAGVTFRVEVSVPGVTGGPTR